MLPETSETTYNMQYRLVADSTPSLASDAMRSRVLDVMRDSGERTPARTDEEAQEAVREFKARPWLDVHVSVLRVTKRVTTTAYEEIPCDA